MLKAGKIFNGNILLNYFSEENISERMTLNESEIHVWILDIQNYNESSLKRLTNILSMDEKIKMSRYMHVKDQKCFLIGHGMLRIVLSQYLQKYPESIIFSENKYGKIHMPQSNVSFNISHSGNKVVLAFAKEMQIGVDIERMGVIEDYAQIAKKFFLPQESKLICSQTDAAKGMEYFYKIWTVKEAYVKAIGCGLSRSLKTFEVLEAGSVVDYSNNQKYNYYSRRLKDNYICSLIVT